MTAWDALHAEATEADMGFISTRFTQGGVVHSHVSNPSSTLDSGLNNGREGFFGWMGLGIYSSGTQSFGLDLVMFRHRLMCWI